MKVKFSDGHDGNVLSLLVEAETSDERLLLRALMHQGSDMRLTGCGAGGKSSNEAMGLNNIRIESAKSDQEEAKLRKVEHILHAMNSLGYAGEIVLELYALFGITKRG